MKTVGTKIAFLLLSLLTIAACSKDDDSKGSGNGSDTRPLEGRTTAMAQVGNTFQVDLGEGIEGVNDISVGVSKLENGVSTISGSVELTNPLLAELASAIVDRFPEYGRMEGNKLSADVELKFTNRGIAFVDRNNNEYTNVEYFGRVGDKFTTTYNGRTYTRTIIGRSELTLNNPGGGQPPLEVPVIEVESKDHGFPNLDKVIYYFSTDYGLVQVTAFFDDGTSKTIQINSLSANTIIPEMGAPQAAFNPAINYGSLTDIDGNTYRTVQIGSQTWMAENLYTTRLNDGSLISSVTTFRSFNEPGWYVFDGDYGFYYNKHAVSSGKLCPDGWRVPTKSDWEILASEVGDIEEVVYGTLGRTGFIAKGRDELASTSNLWEINNNFNNNSGFSILPNGSVFGASGNDIDTKAALWAYSSPDFYLFEVANTSSDGLKARAESSIDNSGYGCRCVKE